MPLLPNLEDDSEDLGALFTSLDILSIDSNNMDFDKYYPKEGEYKSEISNRLKCQVGSCPGVPKSPAHHSVTWNIARWEVGFEKLKPHWILVYIYPLVTNKEWILQVILGLKCLHSVGIVHRDLCVDNLAFTADTTRVLICDLQDRWGNRLAPEVSHKQVLDTDSTEKSDIHDLGDVIKGMI